MSDPMLDLDAIRASHAALTEALGTPADCPACHGGGIHSGGAMHHPDCVDVWCHPCCPVEVPAQCDYERSQAPISLADAWQLLQDIASLLSALASAEQATAGRIAALEDALRPFTLPGEPMEGYEGCSDYAAIMAARALLGDK